MDDKKSVVIKCAKCKKPFDMDEIQGKKETENTKIAIFEKGGKYQSFFYLCPICSGIFSRAISNWLHDSVKKEDEE